MGRHAAACSALPAILIAVVWGFIGLLEPVMPRLHGVVLGVPLRGPAARSSRCWLGSPGMGCLALCGPAAIPGRPPLAHLLQIHRRQLHLLHVNLQIQFAVLMPQQQSNASWR